MPTATSLYLNWSFWAVVVAALAVALSQLPPIHLWFRRAKLDIEVYSRIAIFHKVGNPNVTVYVILNNVGGRKLRVKKMLLNFKRNGSDLNSLPIQNYFEKPDSSGSIIFTPFSLKPGEEWAHSCNFLNFFNRDDEKRFKIMESALRTDIQEKRVLEPDNLVEADPANVKPLLAFFQEKFGWNEGEYEMLLSVKTDRTTSSKNYRFVIFESETAELVALSGDYKYGAGVYWDRPGAITILGMELHEIDA